MNFTKCMVRNCKNKAYPGTTVRFHPLPKDPGLRRKWLSNLNPKIYQTVGWEACALVCGDHFGPEHYDECKRLLKDAVPINTPIPSWRSAHWVDEASVGSQSSIKKEGTNLLSIEISPTSETESLTEDNSPSGAPVITKRIDQQSIEKLVKNEADTPTDDDEAGNEWNESDFEVANESDESNSVASENVEEIETVVCPLKIINQANRPYILLRKIPKEIEDDEDADGTIRVIIDDWDGAGGPKITARVAAPAKVTHNDDDLEVPEIIKACRVCLAMDGRLFRIQTRKHRQMYTDATGIPIAADDGFPHYLCWECAGRVRAAQRLQAKALAARHALMALIYDHGKITMNSVRSINRREHKLTSQLSEKYIKPNEYISFSEVRLKDINDIMTRKNDKELIEENTNVDMVEDNFDADDRTICLFDEIDFIPDRTLIDVDIDMTEDYTDVYANVKTEIDVGDNVNDENVNDVQENDEVGDGNEKADDEPPKGLWVGKLTRHAKWKKELEYWKDFTITTVTKEEEVEMRIDENNTKNARYICNICHRGYLTQSVYEKHVLRHTEKFGNFECDICKVRTPSRPALRGHNRRCHGRKYSCKKCPYVTVDAAMLKRHHKLHGDDKRVCPQCSKKFTTATGMYGHLRTVHLCPIPCEFCGITFPTRQGKIGHLRCVHNIDKDKTPLEGPYCGVCDVTFASRAAHDTHLTKSSKHNDGNTYSRLTPEYFKDFTITNLTKDMEIAEMEKRKEKSAPYKCAVCYRGYLGRACYEDHILKHTDKHGKFECEICKIRKMTEEQLVAHTRKTHRKRYSCKKCAYVTSEVLKARYHHIHQHQGDVQYKCPHCSKEFSRNTTYLGHLRISHPCEFACEYCGSTFRSEKGKLFHQSMSHRFDKDETPIEGPYCGVCDVTFASRAAHDMHLTKSSRHNNDKTSTIRNIYSRHTTPGYYYKRVKKRKRPRDYTPTAYVSVTCELCNQTLPSVRMYVFHFKNAHPGQTRTQYRSGTQAGSRFICEHCGKGYQCTTQLGDHMSVHTGELFECHHCGKKFVRKGLLAIHMNIHDAKRRTYKCTVCPKVFLTRSSRHLHVRASHTNVKPYACEACGVRFVVPSLLRAHIDHVHSGVPRPKRNRRPARTQH